MRRSSHSIIGILRFGVAAYAIAMYGFDPGAQRLHPEMRAVFESHAVGIKTPIFTSALAQPATPPAGKNCPPPAGEAQLFAVHVASVPRPATQ